MSLSVQKVNTYVKAIGKRSLLETRATVFHGVNPALTYKPSGKTFELPRFISEEMKQARQMNRIASKQRMRPPFLRKYSTKLNMDDFNRLTSKTVVDSYSRAIWTNPKDGKVYNLLKEGETDDGKILVRILDNECIFVKNAAITPKTIVIAEPTSIEGSSYSLQINENKFKHYDIMKIIAQRYNPFAKVKTLLSENMDTLFKELHKTKADYLSISFSTNLSFKKKFRLSGACIKNSVINLLQTREPKINKILNDYFNNIPSGTRIFVSSANITKENGYKAGYTTQELFLTQKRVEGVGGLNKFGKKHALSASNNSIFTQHYERFEFPVNITDHGITFSGLNGTDFAMDTSALKDLPSQYICGTSYSTPIRVAKVALNDMMEGIL